MFHYIIFQNALSRNKTLLRAKSAMNLISQALVSTVTCLLCYDYEKEESSNNSTYHVVKDEVQRYPLPFHQRSETMDVWMCCMILSNPPRGPYITVHYGISIVQYM
jgi:hypothetical protein